MICFQLSVPRFKRVIFLTLTVLFFLQTQQRMTLLSNEDNKEISLSTELSQASTEKVTLLVHVHRTKNLLFHWFYVTNSQFHITHNTPCLPPTPRTTSQNS